MFLSILDLLLLVVSCNMALLVFIGTTAGSYASKISKFLDIWQYYYLNYIFNIQDHSTKPSMRLWIKLIFMDLNYIIYSLSEGVRETCKICSNEGGVHYWSLFRHQIKEASEGPHEFFQVKRNPESHIQTDETNDNKFKCKKIKETKLSTSSTKELVRVSTLSWNAWASSSRVNGHISTVTE